MPALPFTAFTHTACTHADAATISNQDAGNDASASGNGATGTTAASNASVTAGPIAASVAGSGAVKGRLLHYFPAESGAGEMAGEWCAWHRDHGTLTGATSLGDEFCSTSA